MAYHNPVEFVKNDNTPLLKEMCTDFIKQNYISNVKKMLEMHLAETFSASEMSYFTGPSNERLMSFLFYSLSMSPSTFLSLPSVLWYSAFWFFSTLVLLQPQCVDCLVPQVRELQRLGLAQCQNSTTPPVHYGTKGSYLTLLSTDKDASTRMHH